VQVCIIGAGALGLGAGYCLAKKGIKSYIFESKNETGGLGASFPLNNTLVEKYHHFVCSGDETIKRIAKDPIINTEIIWFESEMGYFAKDKIYPFTTPRDLLSFKALPLLSRLRFGLGMLYLKSMKDWKTLENISAKEWMIKWTGRTAYETIWGHLFNSKFSGSEDTIPLSWLHARISRRSASRAQNSSKEMFGYVKGSMTKIFDSITTFLEKTGTKINLDSPVSKIKKTKNDNFEVTAKNKKYTFDVIISTIPSPIFTSITEDLPQSYIDDLAKIRYQAIVNVVFQLKKPFSKYFWVNISDKTIPFPGIIELTSLVPSEYFGGKSIIYLPNYMQRSNRLFNLSDKELHEEYIIALEKIGKNSGFHRNDIEKGFTFRDDYADPYYTLNYSKILPPHETPFNGLFLFNTSQIYPTTRNVNSSLMFGEKASDLVIDYLQKKNSK
jgi:protoporphyrinogen oxidase